MNRSLFHQQKVLESNFTGSWESHLIAGMLKGIAINSRDELYIGDIKHKYISKHHKDGSHINSFRVSITPRSLAVTSQEAIVVSDWFETKSVLLLNQSGQCLQVIKPPAMPASRLDTPGHYLLSRHHLCLQLCKY